MIEDNEQDNRKFKMVITIIKRGMGSKVVTASKKSGAEGGSILLGKGTATKNIYQNILGIDFDPEKEVVLSLVQQEHVENVLDAISDEASLKKPGNGIAFVIDIKDYCGIAHLLK